MLIQATTVPFPNHTAGNTATPSLIGVGAGNAIVVVSFGLGKLATPQPSFSVADSMPYTSIAAAQFGTPNWAMVDISVLFNVAAGTHNITSTNSAGSLNSFGYCTAMEWSGLVPSVDGVMVNGSASTGSPTSGATPAVVGSHEIAIACFAYQLSSTQTWTQPSAYTNVFQNTAGGNGSQMVGSVDYKTVLSPGAQSVSWGSFSGANWAAAIVILQTATPVIYPIPSGAKQTFVNETIIQL